MSQHRSRPLTRRRFLGQASGAVLATGFWSEIAPAASKSPNEKLNIGVIGVNNRGQANVIAVGTENIVALCDVDERYLNERADRLPQAYTYFDFRKMLERRDLDAVMINTPDHTHAHAAIKAMRQGLHVYCEKPLAHSIQETRRMAAVARESKVVTQTGNQFHNSAGYRRVAELVQAGTLGAVREVHCWTNRPIWPQGMERPPAVRLVPDYFHWDLWLGPAPERPYAEGYHPMTWRGFWDFGTGALGDRGPHQIDPAFHALKLGAPTAIEAESFGGNAETAPQWSIVRYDFPARDAMPPVKLTWYDGGKLPPAELAGVKRLPDNGTLLIGEKAKLFSPKMGGMPTILPNDPQVALTEPPLSPPPQLDHYQEWVAACKTGDSLSASFEYGARLTEMCLLGNVAIRANERIEWDAAQGEVKNVPSANQYLGREYRRGWELT